MVSYCLGSGAVWNHSFMLIIITTAVLTESPLKLHFKILVIPEISAWTLSTISHLQKPLADKFIIRQ